MAATPPICEYGWTAADFSLPGVDGKTWSLDDVRGPNGTLVMFICNHCPYVLAVLDRICRDVRDLEPLGIGVVAINSNDADAYPDDSFENMKRMAERENFPFPYLHDEDQSVARAYDAVCTPDFYGFNAEDKLEYRGRLDASRSSAGPADLRRDLFEAMKEIAETGKCTTPQVSSMGCSIKWKPVA